MGAHTQTFQVEGNYCNLNEQILGEEQIESAFITVLYKIYWRFIELFAKDLTMSSCLVGFFFILRNLFYFRVCCGFPPVPKFIFQ